MFKVGTVAKVRQIVKAPDGIYRCYVEGLRKAVALTGNLRQDGTESENYPDQEMF